MAELFEGSIIELLLERLLQEVVDAAKRITTFRSSLNSLKSTVFSLKAYFEEVARLNKVLHSPQQETDMFINRLREGETLVRNCSQVKWWNLYKKISYSKKITELENSLTRFFQLIVQADMVRDHKKMLIWIDEVNNKLDDLVASSKSQQNSSETSIGASFKGGVQLRCRARNQRNQWPKSKLLGRG